MPTPSSMILRLLNRHPFFISPVPSLHLMGTGTPKRTWQEYDTPRRGAACAPRRGSGHVLRASHMHARARPRRPGHARRPVRRWRMSAPSRPSTWRCARCWRSPPSAGEDPVLETG
ncbi:hypothetical protein D1007_12962 [Hordeum vulgare]|nr:hypothetical protein D1007_12962 [Hordeum vulgare]